MAGMVGARRALLAARYSPRGALASPVRRVDSPPSLPADRTCLRSLVPHRGAGNFASEQIDGDYHSDEWGARNTENYRESHRADRPSHQVQADIPSTDSSVGADRIRGVNSDGNTNAHYRRNPGQTEFPNHHEPYISARVNNGAPGFNDRQPYVSVNTQYRSNSLQPRQMCGPYGFANPHEPYTSAKANCEAPGYKDKEPYGGGGPYNQQTPSGDLPNTHQPYSHTQGNNSANSGNGTGQTYHHYHGSDAYRSGYNSQNNQQAYDNRHYGYGPSGQSYQKSTGNDQQVFQKQQVDQISAGNSANRPGSSQYGIPSRFNEEHVARFQQGHNGDIGHNISHTQHSPYVSSKIDAQSNLPGHPMNVNTAVQGNTHGIYKEKHFDIQPNALAGNHLSNASAPYQDGIYRNHLLTESPLIDESSGVSDVACGKSKVTVEEMDKLCEDRKIKEAVELLALLQEEGTVVHASQYCKLMQACGDVASLAEARKLHNLISQSALAADTDINNKILEMYSKCGSMEDAKKLFSSSIAQCNLISWNTMIAGFVHNGLGEEATDFFDQFMQTGDNPNSAMFTHVFLACGILGSVDEGMLHFESMQKDFGITPTMEHYVSIVNMLGQSGYIDEACEFVEQMPVEPSIDVWESLMNMCRLNGILEIGDRCAQIVERLDSSRLNEQSKIGLFPVDASELTKEKERKKANAVEARSKVHEYRAGDRSHPEHLKIYEELRYLAAHMKEAGYIADTRFVLHDVDQETKEDALLAHSERLAVSYGLITSAARSPIRVIKNLRSCGDCHTAFKIISKLVGRLIIARDAKRFHHFENGVCSCKDYW